MFLRGIRVCDGQRDWDARDGGTVYYTKYLLGERCVLH
jgi:hypothetical protein